MYKNFQDTSVQTSVSEGDPLFQNYTSCVRGLTTYALNRFSGIARIALTGDDAAAFYPKTRQELCKKFYSSTTLNPAEEFKPKDTRLPQFRNRASNGKLCVSGESNYDPSFRSCFPDANGTVYKCTSSAVNGTCIQANASERAGLLQREAANVSARVARMTQLNILK
jgi:hypothetical protein